MKWLEQVEEQFDVCLKRAGVSKKSMGKLIKIAGFLMIVYVVLKIWGKNNGTDETQGTEEGEIDE